MKTCSLGINWNLLLVAMLMLAVGCASNSSKNSSRQKKKEQSTVQFYLESHAGHGSATAGPIYRKNPVFVPVQRHPFIDGASVVNAAVVEHMESFYVQLQFDQHGRFVLDNITSANRGRRIAIFAQFPENRWLAVPLITQPNSTGVFTFTPDASKEEAERFVRGLNNVAQTLHKTKPKKKG